MTVERATLTKNCLPECFERLALALGYGGSCQSAQRCADSHLQMLLFTKQEIELSGNIMHYFDNEISIFAVSSALKRVFGIKYPYKLSTAQLVCVDCSDLTAEVFVIHCDFGLDSGRILSLFTLWPSIGSHSKEFCV